MKSYGLSAGYIKSKQPDGISKPTSTTAVISTTPELNDAKIVTTESSTKKSYGLSSGYKPSMGSPVVDVNTDIAASNTNNKPHATLQLKSTAPVAIRETETKSETTTESNILTSFIDMSPDIETIPTTAIIKEEEEEKEKEFSFQFLSDLNYEQKLKQAAQLEIVEYSKTYTNLENLKLNLQKSLSRKEEAENMIIGELNQLRPLLNQELVLYESRYKNLLKTLDFLKNAIKNKKSQIITEKELLVQMTDIKNKIYEKRILSEYNIALTKKQELIIVDEELLNILQVTEDTSSIIFFVFVLLYIHLFVNNMLSYYNINKLII